MTYCVGIRLNEGLVLLADTRTNAGVDNISTYRKLFTWVTPGERAIAMMCSGNLSITQGVITRLNRAIKQSANDEKAETILNADTMFRVAQIVGETMREMQSRHRSAMEQSGSAADASIVVAGQRQGGEQRLYLVYSAGNFIEAGADTCYYQIGDHKYGKPILDRVMNFRMPLVEAVKVGLISMDSTLRSNLSVGLPVDLLLYRRDHPGTWLERRFEEGDPYFEDIRNRWSDALRAAYREIPDLELDFTA